MGINVNEINNNEKKYAKDTSIIIFTHNRPHFIKRFVLSLNYMNFGGVLIISESSSSNNHLITNEFLENNNFQFKVIHLYVPKKDNDTISTSINDCLKKGVEAVNTKYVMITSDDDVPIPQTLQKCEHYLNANPAYNGANGEYPCLDIEQSQYEHGFFSNPMVRRFWKNENLNGRRKIYRSTGLEKNSAAERLLEIVDFKFHTIYAVVRADTYKHIIPANANDIKYPHFCAEYNWMFIIAMFGKIKHLKLPQVIRQYHGENLSIKNDKHPYPTYLEAMFDEQWPSDATKFVENMANIISLIDGVDDDEARDCAIEAFRRITISRLLKPAPVKHYSILSKLFKCLPSS